MEAGAGFGSMGQGLSGFAPEPRPRSPLEMGNAGEQGMGVGVVSGSMARMGVRPDPTARAVCLPATKRLPRVDAPLEYFWVEDRRSAISFRVGGA